MKFTTCVAACTVMFLVGSCFKGDSVTSTVQAQAPAPSMNENGWVSTTGAGTEYAVTNGPGLIICFQGSDPQNYVGRIIYLGTVNRKANLQVIYRNKQNNEVMCAYTFELGIDQGAVVGSYFTFSNGANFYPISVTLVELAEDSSAVFTFSRIYPKR